MAPDVTPEEIRLASFRTVRRGLDPTEVSEFLDRVADRVADLTEEQERLKTQIGDFADRDLESEFDNLGREVAAVLQAAREAAESMRDRATADAARWRSEAAAEVEAMRKQARTDAESLRGDAWTTGSELLSQAASEARRIRAEAERDVLSVMGEAEREAHRLTSTARREAEDVLRSSTMDAEKTASEAKKRHDEIIEMAHRQAEAAQERTRALEERREELMEELETVRAALSRLEGTLEEKRESLESPAESTSVRVVPAPKTDPDEIDWAIGETVRVIPPAGSRPLPPEPEDLFPRRDSGPVPEPEPEPEPEPAPVPEPEPEPVPVPVPEPEPEPIPGPEPEAPSAAPRERAPQPKPEADPVGDLFASLRGQPPTRSEPKRPPPATEAEPSGVDTTSPLRLSPHHEMIEERDARLLPITNRALRGVKKAVTDAQNLALDSLRTDDGWFPEGPTLAEMMRADLIGLWAESYSAGHATAEDMTGEKLRRPETPPSTAADNFGADLAEAVSSALIQAGDGQRERQSAASRVFRGWRTDEAERRVRELALSGYHRGVAESVADVGGLEWVASGTPCSACRSAAANPGSNLPPVHTGCECTVVLA
jgi:DivIVA domain-containing protein